MRYGVAHMSFNDPQLPFVDHRAYIGIGIEPTANTELLRFLDASFQKRFIQTAMHIAALYREARLPGIQERSPHCRAGSYIYIGIIEDDHGIFSAQLQH